MWHDCGNECSEVTRNIYNLVITDFWIYRNLEDLLCEKQQEYWDSNKRCSPVKKLKNFYPIFLRVSTINRNWLSQLLAFSVQFLRWPRLCSAPIIVEGYSCLFDDVSGGFHELYVVYSISLLLFINLPLMAVCDSINSGAQEPKVMLPVEIKNMLLIFWHKFLLY